MNKKNLMRFITIIITALITCFITCIVMYGKTPNKTTESLLGEVFSNDKIETKLELIRRKIDSEYKGNVDENKLMEYAVKGYVAGLGDRYSEYFTKEEMNAFTEDTQGEFVGIGVYITSNTEKDAIVVLSTIKNSPAQKIGIQKDDIIKEVDGVKYTAKDFNIISNYIKGKAGTNVKLIVERDGKDIEYNVTREKVIIPSVESSVLSNNIGYIYISSFTLNTSSEFKNEYNELVSKGIKSLIIDVRDNGGGILDETLKIGDMLTDKGKILLVEQDKDGKEILEYSKNEKIINMNFVLLVNESSASASEVLAGTVKDDCDNGTIIGTKTFGKGIIQSLYTLSDGSGVKLTTEEYFTPKHTAINGIGIEPDIKIDYNNFLGIVDEENDTQLQEAIKHLTK